MWHFKQQTFKSTGLDRKAIAFRNAILTTYCVWHIKESIWSTIVWAQSQYNVIKLCLVFKCLNGQCSEYLSSTLTRVSDISMRQSRHGSLTLRCPKYSRETEGGRTFAVAAVKEWNKLPIKIRSSQNVKIFKKNYVNYLKESYIGLDHFSIS